MRAAFLRSQVGARPYISLAVALAALTLAALWGRVGGMSWVSVSEPHTLRLVQGHTVQYESGYFVHVVRAMAGASAPESFTTAHYRMWLPQLVAAVFLSWGAGAFWSLALVDLLGAVVGVVGFVWLGRQLGLGLLVTLVAGTAYALSPIFASYMWRNQLHVQAIGSIAWGSAASLYLVATDAPKRGAADWQSVRNALARALALGMVWLAVSWQYQFHAVLIPAMLCLAATERSTNRWSLVVWSAALAVFFALSGAAVLFLTAAGIPILAENNDPRNTLHAFTSWLLTSDPATIARHAFDALSQFGNTFHPVTMAFTLAGILVLPRRALVYCAAILTLTAAFLFVRNLDRVAHPASAAVYLSSAAGAVGLPGRIVAVLATFVPSNLSLPAQRGAIRAVTLGLFLWVIVSQNSDLWRDYQSLGPTR